MNGRRPIKELWYISKYVFRELLFSSFAQTRGLDLSDEKAVEKLLKSGSIRLYKIMMLFIVIIYTIPSYLFYDLVMYDVPQEILPYVSSLYVSSILLMNAFIVFFISIMQSSQIFRRDLYEPLFILTLSPRDISIIAFLVFFRIFDLFIVGTFITTIVFLYLSTRNVLFGTVIAFTQIALFIIFMWIVILISKRFLKDLWKPEASGLKSLLKIITIIVYTLAFSLAYLMPTIVSTYVTQAIRNGISTEMISIIQLIPPLSVVLIASDTLLYNTLIGINVYSIFSSVLFIVLTLYALRSTLVQFRNFYHQISEVRITHEKRAKPYILRFKIYRGLKGIIVKDFKILIRNPNFAMIFFLGPIMFLSYYLIGKFLIYGDTNAFLLQFSVFIASMYLFTSPSLLSVEAKYLEFVRTLPISTREYINSKAILLVLSYIAYIVTILVYFGSIGMINHLVIAIALNIMGIYASVFVTIRKMLKNVILEDVSIATIQSSGGLMIFMVAILFFYILIPIGLAFYAIVNNTPLYQFILVLILLQIVYYGTTKIGKLPSL